RRVDAAVVELDPLADPVGTAAEDEDLFPVGRYQFILLSKARIEIWRKRFELCRARIDEAEGGQNSVFFSLFTHGFRIAFQQVRQLEIAESVSFRLAQLEGGERLEGAVAQAFLH